LSRVQSPPTWSHGKGGAASIPRRSHSPTSPHYLPYIPTPIGGAPAIPRGRRPGREGAPRWAPLHRHRVSGAVHRAPINSGLRCCSSRPPDDRRGYWQ
jgi:hypothetical protein